MQIEIPVWSLKYKPKSLKDICGREDNKNQLKEFISRKNFPHLLITGKEAVGKTTIARCFSKEILGEYFDSNFEILYANVPVSQEERSEAGISKSFSRGLIGSKAGKTRYIHPFLDIKVKPFVQIKVLGDAPFKILIVKNFEALGQFQQGFRRLMETYSSNCRIIIITSRISSIIDPIISRCQIMFIPQIDINDFKNLINGISEAEGILINDKTTKILFDYSKGRINEAINVLQLASMKTSSVNSEVLYSVIKESRNEGVSNLLSVIYNGDFLKARQALRVYRKEFNFSAPEILKKMMDEIIQSPFSKRLKIELINFIADAEFKCIDGQGDDIQLSGLISKLCLLSDKLKRQ